MADSPGSAAYSENLDAERAKRVYLGLPDDAKAAADALMAQGLRGRDAVARVYAQHMQNVMRTSAEADDITKELTPGENASSAAMGLANTIGHGLAPSASALVAAVTDPRVGAAGRAYDDQKAKEQEAEDQAPGSFSGGKLLGEGINAAFDAAGGVGVKRFAEAAAPVVKRGVGRMLSRGAQVGHDVAAGKPAPTKIAAAKDAIKSLLGIGGEVHPTNIVEEAATGKPVPSWMLPLTEDAAAGAPEPSGLALARPPRIPVDAVDATAQASREVPSLPAARETKLLGPATPETMRKAALDALAKAEPIETPAIEAAEPAAAQSMEPGDVMPAMGEPTPPGGTAPKSAASSPTPTTDAQMAANASGDAVARPPARWNAKERMAEIGNVSGRTARQQRLNALASHGQRQLQPIVDRFGLEMPANAPKFSTTPAFDRAASMEGAHTPKQMLTGTPFAEHSPDVAAAFDAQRIGKMGATALPPYNGPLDVQKVASLIAQMDPATQGQALSLLARSDQSAAAAVAQALAGAH